MMDGQSLPTPDHLRQLLQYEPETGKFFWRTRTPDMFEAGTRSAEHYCSVFNNTFAGEEAFTSDDGSGYLQSRIQNRYHLRAHRVAFAIMEGRWPNDEIDHINGNRADNRWANLREVTRSENNKNKGRSKHSNSPFVGLSRTPAGRWRVRIKVNRQEVHIGVFSTQEEAVAARKQAQARHGFHTNHGRT